MNLTCLLQNTYFSNEKLKNLKVIKSNKDMKIQTIGRVLFSFLIITILFACTKTPTPPIGNNTISISSVTPAVLTPGETITITGVGFSSTLSDNLVLFGSLPATVTASSATSLTVIVPSGLMSASTITVEVKGVTYTGTSTYPFMKAGISTGSITQISPDSASVGATITITGTGFSTDKDSNQVTINNINAPVTVATATQLTLTVPAGSALANDATGALNLTVKGGGVLFAASNPFTVLAPSGSITSISSSVADLGATISIVGTGFNSVPSNNKIYFNGTLLTSGITLNGNTLTATLPSQSSNYVKPFYNGIITVSSNGKLLQGGFDLTIHIPNTLIGIFPNPAQAGSTVQIIGSGFSPIASENIISFFIGDGFTSPTLVASKVNGDTLFFIVPLNLNAAYGPHPIGVSANGTKLNNSSPDFEIIPGLILTPTSGKAGDKITFTSPFFGTNPNAIKVYIGNDLCTIMSTNLSSNMVTVVVPTKPYYAFPISYSVSAKVNGVEVPTGFLNTAAGPSFTYNP